MLVSIIFSAGTIASGLVTLMLVRAHPSRPGVSPIHGRRSVWIGALITVICAITALVLYLVATLR